jgi:hypothetical protein
MSEQSGLYAKYNITKADGTPTDSGADYFVLRLDTDFAARLALFTYATAIQEKNPALAKALFKHLDEYLEGKR